MTDANDTCKHCGVDYDELAASEAKLKLAEKALEFYANRENWTITTIDQVDCIGGMACDEGDEARTALAELKKS